MAKKFLFSYLEVPFITLAFFAGWYLLGRYALGGPIKTDITVYMNVGMNHIENTFILNRYFHIFLEAVFLKLAPTPLVGFQYFWAFLMAATALLVYYNARTFTTWSNFIHGLLAVGIFFSFTFFAQNTGIAYVDTTAMLMVMALVTVFMASVRRQHRSEWLLVALGLLFFLAFKTKETTLVTGLLFIGVGFQDGQFRFKKFLNRMIYILAGFLGGIILFSLLNWIILDDPLFGLRLSDIREFLTTYVVVTTKQSQQTAENGNWYTIYLLGVTYIPFVLYLISGIRVSPDLDFGQRLVWWIPPALVCLVSLLAGFAQGPRFLLPALPVISLLGPQFLEFTIPDGGKERLKMGVVAAVALGALLVIRLAMRAFVSRMGWDASLFYVAIYEPAILSIILAISFLWKRLSSSISVVIAVLILALIVSPLVSNAKLMFKSPNRAYSDLTFYPYSAFSKETHFEHDMRMFVSLNAWKILGVSGSCNTLDDVLDLFNIYFDTSSTRSNFTVSSDPAMISSDVMSANYTYILISQSDWQAIPDVERSILMQRYNQMEDKIGVLVFLQAK